MARGDISISSQGGHDVVPSVTYKVQAAATAIKAGEPVKLAAAGGSYVVLSADAEPVTGTPTFVGIAASDSTQTATADGVVSVYESLPGVIYKAFAKDKTNIDTVAEVDAVINNRTVLDLTSGVFTIDTAAIHAATNGIQIVNANKDTGEVYFKIVRTVLADN